MKRKRRTIGKDTLSLSIIFMLVLGAIAFLSGAGHFEKSECGLFLPSPESWIPLPIASVGTNLLLLIAIGITSVFFNRHYNFVKTSQPVGQTAFFLMAGSNVLVTGELGTSTLLLIANFVCFSFLFDTYRKPNATQEFFIVATIIALGSMVQYAFLMMIPVFIAAGFILQAMRIREILAFGMGLIAPFWVGIGLGLLPLEQFRLPRPTILFLQTGIEESSVAILVNIGFTLLTAILMFLNNEIKLYAGNSRVLALNNIISVSRLAAAICMIADYDNLPAYLATFYYACSYQTANLFALRDIKRGPLLMDITAIIYAALFAATLLT